MDDALNLVGYDLHDAAKVLQHHGVDLEVDKIVNFLITTVSTRISRHVPWRDHAAETRLGSSPAHPVRTGHHVPHTNCPNLC